MKLVARVLQQRVFCLRRHRHCCARALPYTHTQFLSLSLSLSREQTCRELRDVYLELVEFLQLYLKVLRQHTRHSDNESSLVGHPPHLFARLSRTCAHIHYTHILHIHTRAHTHAGTRDDAREVDCDFASSSCSAAPFPGATTLPVMLSSVLAPLSS